MVASDVLFDELEQLKRYPYLIMGSREAPRAWWPIVFGKTTSAYARMGSHGLIVGTPRRPSARTARALILKATEEFARQWGSDITVLWSDDEETICKGSR